MGRLGSGREAQRDALVERPETAVAALSAAALVADEAPHRVSVRLLKLTAHRAAPARATATTAHGLRRTRQRGHAQHRQKQERESFDGNHVALGGFWVDGCSVGEG